MRFARLALVVGLVGLWPGLVQAGDYFFECAIPGGGYTLQEGDKQLELLQDGKKLKYDLVRQVTIREKEGVCTTKGGQKFKWGSHSYLYEVKTAIDGMSIPLLFLCEMAGSGVPANVSDCTETTTRDKQLQPSYADKAQ